MRVQHHKLIRKKKKKLNFGKYLIYDILFHNEKEEIKLREREGAKRV